MPAEPRQGSRTHSSTEDGRWVIARKVVGEDMNRPPGNSPAPDHTEMRSHHLAARTLLGQPHPTRYAKCAAVRVENPRGRLDLYPAHGDEAPLPRTAGDGRVYGIHV